MFEIKDYVLEINKTKSFSRAASNLFLSQPALSMSIKRLEEEIGEPIFDRSTHPIRLTECGKQYLKAANIIKNCEEEFVSFINDYKGKQCGTVIIGGSNMNISYVVPGLLDNFHKKYPNIETKLVEGHIHDLRQMLLDGDIDVIVDSGDTDSNLFDEYIYNRENLILMIPYTISCNQDIYPYRLTYEDIMNIKHTEPSTPALPLNMLGAMPFIWMAPETDTYQKTEKLCKLYSYVPKIKMVFNQQSTAFHVACSGAGATFISDELLRNAQVKPKAFFYKVEPSIGTRYIKLYTKKARPLTYPMEALIEIAYETGRKFIETPSS